MSSNNNSKLTQDEIKAIQEFFNNKLESKNIDEDLQETLSKIGMILPVSNRGGKGKNIIKILNN